MKIIKLTKNKIAKEISDLEYLKILYMKLEMTKNNKIKEDINYLIGMTTERLIKEAERSARKTS